ncbi:hypothetical protein F511_34428 [Dorcoceras hygrometricum]|uniref:Uncharacterized protein n=1 Tax=Dorcoceras hygrometricum TaxID=472368 RepID=A0A2Z7AZ83_9LAMI|nr:hypothetical protein F511_34428 [Dorcoceras hygrometricum]
MSIDDILKRIPEEMMLPSYTTVEPTQIKFGHSIKIKERDWHKANLPKISVDAKGKELLVEEVVKGHPAHTGESYKEIVSFFYSFSLRRLEVLESVSDIVAKEEHILVWTDSLQTAVQRRMYIIVKYNDVVKSSSPCVDKLGGADEATSAEVERPSSSNLFGLVYRLVEFFHDFIRTSSTGFGSENLNSSSDSSSSDSPMHFTADDIPEISSFDEVLPVEEITITPQISLQLLSFNGLYTSLCTALSYS